MSTELVEYEETALARREVLPARQDAIAYLAEQPDEEFERRLEMMRTVAERIERVKLELLVPGIDFGTVPGIKQPFIKKPGLEKLAQLFHLEASFHPDVQYGDGERSPDISVIVRCDLRGGDADGPVLASGLGACNSWERKYRYRRGERACPACGTEGSIRRSSYEHENTGEKGWYCREESCKAKFAKGDPAITGQQVGDVDNPDPFDLQNTLLKMAEIRALRNAVLRGTASSGLFSSEDAPDDGAGGRAPRQQPARPAPQRPRQDAAPAPPAGAAPAQGVVYCSEHGCRSSLSKGALTYSEKHFGRPLCPAHQKSAQQPPAAAPAEDPKIAKLRATCRAVYQRIGRDPDDLLGLHDDQTAMLGSSEESWTLEQWQAWAEHLERVGWQQIEGEPESAAAEEPVEDPFVEEPSSAQQIAMGAVERAEAGTYAQQSGF